MVNIESQELRQSPEDLREQGPDNPEVTEQVILQYAIFLEDGGDVGTIKDFIKRVREWEDEKAGAVENRAN